MRSVTSFSSSHMLYWRFRQIGSVAVILSLIGGCAALAYAAWLEPLSRADAALAAADPDEAVAAYTEADARFRRVPLLQRVLADDHARAVHNQLALLYESGDYDGVITKSEGAPPGATPRFWAGCALFALASREEKPEVRLVLLSRAEGEFKQALEASPDDWDAKFNYEVTARLVEELRKTPTTEPDTLMHLLRPQQKQPKAVRKRG